MLGSGWITRPDWTDPIKTIWNLISGYAGQNTIQNTFFGLLVLILLQFGLTSDTPPLPSSWIFVIGLAAPITAIWVFSQYRPLFVDRYFIIFVPYLTILIAKGAGRISSKIKDVIHTKKTYSIVMALLIAVPFTLGLWAGSNTLTGQKYARENWRELSSDLSQGTALSSKVWLSDPYLVLPLQYYFDGNITKIDFVSPPDSEGTYWWILRQNFTYTHAYTQSINPTRREWIPENS